MLRLSIQPTLLVLAVELFWQDKGKQVVKMIKTQRDYFKFSPIIRKIPFVGKIYANQELRFVLGRIQSSIAIAGFKFVKYLLPTELGQFILG